MGRQLSIKVFLSVKNLLLHLSVRHIFGAVYVNTDVRNQTGKKIRQVRNDKGLSQLQIAEKLNITVPALSKIETGHTDINLSRLAQIAAVFGLSLAEVLTYGDHGNQTAPEAESLLAELDKQAGTLQKKVIDLYNQLRDK